MNFILFLKILFYPFKDEPNYNKQINQLGSSVQAKITAINYYEKKIFAKTALGECIILTVHSPPFEFCVNQCVMIEKDQNRKIIKINDYDVWERNQKSLSKNMDSKIIEVLKEQKIISNRFEKACIFISLFILFGWMIFK